MTSNDNLTPDDGGLIVTADGEIRYRVCSSDKDPLVN